MNKNESVRLMGISLNALKILQFIVLKTHSNFSHLMSIKTKIKFLQS